LSEGASFTPSNGTGDQARREEALVTFFNLPPPGKSKQLKMTYLQSFLSSDLCDEELRSF